MEELNEDGVREAGIPVSALQDVSQAHRVPHRFCEPDRAQRAALGIRDAGTIRSDAFLKEIEPHEVDEEITRQLKHRLESAARDPKLTAGRQFPKL